MLLKYHVFWQERARDVASVLTPRSVSPRLKFQMPQSRLGLETERLGLGLGLDTEGLGLDLGLGSKCLGLVGKHLRITYKKLCLNMPLQISLTSRLPPLPFRTTSVLRMMWMWDMALWSWSRLEVQQCLSSVSPQRWYVLASSWSRLGLNCQCLGLVHIPGQP